MDFNHSNIVIIISQIYVHIVNTSSIIAATTGSNYMTTASPHKNMVSIAQCVYCSTNATSFLYTVRRWTWSIQILSCCFWEPIYDEHQLLKSIAAGCWALTRIMRICHSNYCWIIRNTPWYSSLLSEDELWSLKYCRNSFGSNVMANAPYLVEKDKRPKNGIFLVYLFLY